MCLKIVLASVPFLSLITVNRLPRHFYSKYDNFFACLKFTFLSLTVIVISKFHQYETAYFTTISKIRYDFMETFFLLNLTIFKFPAHPAIIVINKLLLWDLNLGPLSQEPNALSLELPNDNSISLFRAFGGKTCMRKVL